MTTRFDRDGLIDGLRQLIAKLRETDGPTGLRIIGGAALALRYFERESTVDIDARPIGDAEPVLEAGRAIAAENGWPEDWLNSKASGFIPEYGAAVTDWHTLYDDGTVVVQVASAEAMLVMKLRANRPGRDERDLANLMAIGGITTVDDAEALYESYYPADLLPDRAVRMVERILKVGLPQAPPAPPRPDLGS
ncbi:hypothetical protein [Agromyces sp. Leaf222]|uniref:hypothetical protein n=1 Tax=Agromyces sp. Leaf222 TaxID=1735688 RepID=UPI0006FDA5AC|nr:hypothetical protein [Agromyces sp. Leaf222]KQM82595.1 hypothetical protein ASE68_04275 [Agromyces sp. Leaf222]